MSLPQRPPPAEPPQRSSWVPLLMAGAVGLAIVSALVMLTGALFGLVIVGIAALFAIAAFHYLVWGWWLSGRIRESEAAEDDRAQRGAGDDPRRNGT